MSARAPAALSARVSTLDPGRWAAVDRGSWRPQPQQHSAAPSDARLPPCLYASPRSSSGRIIVLSSIKSGAALLPLPTQQLPQQHACPRRHAWPPLLLAAKHPRLTLLCVHAPGPPQRPTLMLLIESRMTTLRLLVARSAADLSFPRVCFSLTVSARASCVHGCTPIAEWVARTQAGTNAMQVHGKVCMAFAWRLQGVGAQACYVSSPLYASSRSRCSPGSSTTTTSEPPARSSAASLATTVLLPLAGCPHTTMNDIDTHYLVGYRNSSTPSSQTQV
jgi:hypothetical protein